MLTARKAHQPILSLNLIRMSMGKFYTLSRLKTVLEKERYQKKTIALAKGRFDLIHIGHIRYLKGARKTADILVMALNSGQSQKKLIGKSRIILDQNSRVRLLASFECVDYVTLCNEGTVDHVLLTLKPDIYCKGSDHSLDKVPDIETIKSYGGKIAIVGGEKVKSTSQIIKHLRSE
jgi:rfaE bifunctional protein nucleotidyltransferase chain/domain